MALNESVRSVAPLDIAQTALECLAEVRIIPLKELIQEHRVQGDTRIESVEAVVIISRIEAEVGRPLVEAADLEPDELTSLNTLIGVLAAKLDAVQRTGS